MTKTHFFAQVLVVELRVDTREHSDALVHLATFLALEKQVLRKAHEVRVQVVRYFRRVERLEEHLNQVAEALNQDVQLVARLRPERVLHRIFLRVDVH